VKGLSAEDLVRDLRDGFIGFLYWEYELSMLNSEKKLEICDVPWSNSFPIEGNIARKVNLNFNCILNHWSPMFFLGIDTTMRDEKKEGN
jgi:hypothetical protein